MIGYKEFYTYGKTDTFMKLNTVRQLKSVKCHFFVDSASAAQKLHIQHRCTNRFTGVLGRNWSFHFKKLSHVITFDSLWRNHNRSKKRGNCWFWGVLYQSELDADPSLHVLFWVSFFAYCILQLFLHRFLYHRIFMTHVVVWESLNVEVACVCFGWFVEFWEKKWIILPPSKPLQIRFRSSS